MNSRYALDRSNGKILGVCAGLARSTGWDPLAIRLGAALAAFVFPVAILMYLVAGWIAETR